MIWTWTRGYCRCRSVASSSTGGLQSKPFTCKSQGTSSCPADWIPYRSSANLRSRFTTHFHPHLPVVGSISINQVYQSSPFLFWTIIAVVVTRLTTRFEPGLDTRLQEPVRQMVSREALVSPLPLHKIHALLILCTWPLPAESQNQDPSWLYAGVAVNAARYMGLHRASAPPPLRSIGVVSGGLQSRTRTWLVCFYVGNSLAMLSGLPPLISSPPDVGTIRDFMTKFPAPPEFELNVKTNLAIANLTNTLFHSESDVVDSSLIQLLDSELNGLMTRPSERWADFNEIGILSCRLHIYVMVITKSQTAAQTRDILLRLGFAAALRIIHLAVHLTHPTAPLSTNPLADMPPLPADQLYRTYPKGFFRTLAFSTIFLYRFFVLSANAPTEEQQLASKHAAMAQRLFTSCAYKPQDELGRGAALFEALSRAPVVSDDTTKLSRWLSDRMAAAIMLEGMRIGAEVRGMPVHIVEENAEGDTGDALLFADPSDPDDLGLDEMNLSVDDEAWLAEAEAAAEAAAIDYQSHQFWSDAAWNMLSYDFGGTQM
ncbi:hypothetical protein GQ53DRAFT_462617 [Thozetella sp. PMI_491]|nr:hypothetical protein GQ53DRAFT_462617 [Thozetella sp. PMI_491]